MCEQAAAELARARVEAAAAAEAAAGPQVCDSWEWMVEGVLREVLGSLDFPALKRFRLTCERWRRVADRNLQARSDSGALTEARQLEITLHFIFVHSAEACLLELSALHRILVLAKAQQLHSLHKTYS